MKMLAIAALSAALVGCAGRAVSVQSAPRGVPATLTVTNKLASAVNVFVVSGGSDHFLKQVGPGTTEALSVSTVAVGSTVTLKAVATDGSKTYTRNDVTLQSAMTWTVP